jgi:competence ComEA-like helix-hairpin-helix protein
VLNHCANEFASFGGELKDKGLTIIRCLVSVSLAFCAGLAPLAVAQTAGDRAAPNPNVTRDLPSGEGRAIVQQDCKGCHALKVVTSKRASKEQWSSLVNQMISRGAEVADEDVETLVSYLAKNFGVTKELPGGAKTHDGSQPINVNKATAAQLTEALALSPKESASIVSYRERNGNFKEWLDLTKVPGIEAKKLERCKDRLVF